MNKMIRKIRNIFIVICLALCGLHSEAQEVYLPFLDDFSSYSGEPRRDLWIGENCFVNHNYQYLPPSVGVVTLDVIDKNGNLYPSANTLGFVGDTLCSAFIHLDCLASQTPLQVKDSVYMSFFVQPGGGAGNMWERIGSQPSSKDSLVLQFFSATENTWNTVWSMRGESVDSLYAKDSNYFRYVLIPINEEKYFNAYFQFRFLNYASLDANPQTDYVINCDQWNIDYVYIDYNRSLADSSFRDIAFVNPAQSLLKDYVAVPYKQYRPSMMKDSLTTTIANLYSSPLSSTYKYHIYDKNQNEIYFYDGGFENINPLLLTHEFQTSENHIKPPLQFAFDLMNQETEYEIVHIATEGVGQDNLQSNDTIRFKQIFSNYFAYDDGTSEGGFGINPLKGSNLALGFSLNQEDTLNAVDIYFNKTYNQDSTDKKYFFLCVWNAIEQGDISLPNNIIYKSERLLPHSDSLNKFTRYYLSEPLILTEGDFFVSLEIKNKGDYINIGFDRNNNASSHTFSKLANGTEWEQAFVVGALMIRPYFGYKSVGLDNVLSSEVIRIYPNPAKDIIYIDSKQTIKEIYLTSPLGIREKMNFTSFNQGVYSLNISNKKSGMYLLSIEDEKGNIYSKQIIKH
ncbi:MAG: T9SS type A sorting domain-containing protein [Bacteroidota bacterium]|nr:T9SS type A sorting domain-containing protein [Bacteroidota bacterium]